MWPAGVTYLEMSHEGRLVAFCFAGTVEPLAGKGEGGEGEDMAVHSMTEQAIPAITNTA